MYSHCVGGWVCVVWKAFWHFDYGWGTQEYFPKWWKHSNEYTISVYWRKINTHAHSIEFLCRKLCLYVYACQPILLTDPIFFVFWSRWISTGELIKWKRTVIWWNSCNICVSLVDILFTCSYTADMLMRTKLKKMQLEGNELKLNVLSFSCTVRMGVFQLAAIAFIL